MDNKIQSHQQKTEDRSHMTGQFINNRSAACHYPKNKIHIGLEPEYVIFNPQYRQSGQNYHYH